MSEAEIEVDEDLSVEEKAGLVGWKEDGELSAEDFLARKDDNLGLMRANNDRLYKEVSELKATTKEMASFLKAAQEESRKQGYAEAMSEIEDRQAQAVADGDPEAFKEAKAEEKKLLQEQQTTQASDAKGTDQEAAQKVFAEFQSKHKDVFEDFGKSQTFMNAARWAAGNGYRGEEALEKALEETRKAHPAEKVPNVDGGGEGGGGSRKSGGKKDYASLPKSAKAACKEFGYDSPEMQEKYAAIWHKNNSK